jgi:hypothetical protein
MILRKTRARLSKKTHTRMENNKNRPKCWRNTHLDDDDDYCGRNDDENNNNIHIAVEKQKRMKTGG